MKIKIAYKAAAAAAAACLALAAASCSKHSDAAVGVDTLVRIDKAELTRQDLKAAMPAGISADDSVKFAHAYIRSWIDTQLASQIAAHDIDMTEIDKMVEQYRNELIMFEYGRQMYSANASEFAEDTLRAYYDAHKDEFVLSRPMVKGVYLKVADDSKSLPKLRKIYRSTKESDIDNLDKSELDGAVHYDYFRDNWIDFEQIESRIPCDFGASADSWLNQHRNIDFSQGGFTYLLDITEVLHSGQTMPYEAAKSMIADRMRMADRRAYDAQLRSDLYDKALSEGRMTINCDL